MANNLGLKVRMPSNRYCGAKVIKTLKLAVKLTLLSTGVRVTLVEPELEQEAEI